MKLTEKDGKCRILKMLMQNCERANALKCKNAAEKFILRRAGPVIEFRMRQRTRFIAARMRLNPGMNAMTQARRASMPR